MAQNASGVATVTTKQAAACIEIGYHMRRPIMLWGPPGIGKSALVYQATQRLDIGFIDCRLAQMDPVDLRGLPYKDLRDQQVVMGFAPNSLLPRTGAGILFLDEIAQAPQLTQNAASELILDRRLGDYRLPDGWTCMAASNRRQDRAATQELPSHLKNRLFHLEVVPRSAEWIEWGEANKIHPHVIGFVRSNPKHLTGAFNPDTLAFASARTWEFASDVVWEMERRIEEAKARGEKFDWIPLRDAMLAGCLGEAIGIEFAAYLERLLDSLTYPEVIADPEGIKLPSKPSQSFNLIGMVSAEARIEDVDALIKFLNRLPAKEEAMLCLTQMMGRNDDGKGSPGREFEKHPKLAQMMKELSAREPETQAKIQP